MSEAGPGVVQMLKERYDEWNQSLPPCAWTNISPVFKKMHERRTMNNSRRIAPGDADLSVDFDLSNFLPHRLAILSRLTQVMLAALPERD
jgi:hypothetical protein